MLVLQGRLNGALHFGDPFLVPLVEGPLLDTLGSQQSCLSQDPEVLAGRRLRDAELLSDEHTAYAIAHQVAVDLRGKVRPRVLEPAEYFEAPLVRKRLDDVQGYHTAKLPTS